MDPADPPLTLELVSPEPYIHVDNRALVLFDGCGSVMYGSATFPWLAETLRVLLEERRATRQQGPQVFGGVLDEDGNATIYAGSTHHLATVKLTAADLEALRAKLARH